jgi:hypothetical protein
MRRPQENQQQQGGAENREQRSTFFEPSHLLRRW